MKTQGLCTGNRILFNEKELIKSKQKNIGVAWFVGVLGLFFFSFFLDLLLLCQLAEAPGSSDFAFPAAALHPAGSGLSEQLTDMSSLLPSV